jgi:hypothetical protein
MDQYTLIDIVEFISLENCEKIVNGLEIFKYFERSIRIETMIKYGWDEKTCTRAAADGNLKCLKCAHENGLLWDEHSTFFTAVFNGHFKCLKYLYENGCPFDLDVYVYAYLNGPCKILTYLSEIIQ